MTKEVKRAMVATIITVVLVVLGTVTMAIMDDTHDTYTVHGKIVTTTSNGYCAVVDDDGEKWALYTDDTVECGDRVIIVLDNMGTSTIYDDEVVGLVMEE